MGEHSLRMEEFPGTEDYRSAETFIRRQIDSGYPVPYFMLRHKKAYYKDFVWHWFLCYGYEERSDVLWIIVRHIRGGVRISTERPVGCRI